MCSAYHNAEISGMTLRHYNNTLGNAYLNDKFYKNNF